MNSKSCFRAIVRRPSLLVLAFTPLLAVPAAAQDVQLKLLPAGAMSKMGGYVPQRLALSGDKPEGLGRLPADLAAPLYGTLKLGASEAPTLIAVVLDEPDGKPSRLFVDTNANGDLTDDPAPTWTSRIVKAKEGADYHQFSGSARVNVSLGLEKAVLNLPMYRFDKRDPARPGLHGFLFYYTDYAREGRIAFGEKAYQVLLADQLATGDFRGKDGAAPGVMLFIDANEDGKFDRRNEAFDVRKPFNIGGTTYEIAGLTAGGESFRIQKSTRKVAEKKAVAALAVGKPALSFSARMTNGETVNFPSSYKGRIVLLDFWAIWCGPCVAELPHLTAAYQKFHPQGFDVLGISLDRAGDDRKLADFTKQKKMPWPQVFDGKFWSAEVAKLYDVHSIPAAFLVDGDTGLVIATAGLRGATLEKTIAAALAKKGGQ